MSYGRDEEYGGGNRYGTQGGYGASDSYETSNPYGASNPYGSSAGGYGASNPYGSSNPYGQTEEYGSSNPYGQSNPYGSSARNVAAEVVSAPVVAQPSIPTQATSNYSRPAGYQTSAVSQGQTYAAPSSQPTAFQESSQVTQTSGVMSSADFLVRVDGVRAEIRQLTANIAEIGTLHQRALGSPDNTTSVQLDNLVAQTQILNTRIKDQIKLLELDAAKSNGVQTKDTQIRTLKSNFKSQLDEYQKEELAYRQRYRDQIKRQYKIVNPEASNEEADEAANADWGDEGVFQTALRSNRTGAANSVLGAVRARHNDIQQINKTLIELQGLFNDLATAVEQQHVPVAQVEQQTQQVHQDTTKGVVELEKAEKSARHARKLKWICFFIVLLIIVILALVLGLYFGLHKNTTT